MKGIIRNKTASQYTFFNFSMLYEYAPRESIIWKTVIRWHGEIVLDNVRELLRRSYVKHKG